MANPVKFSPTSAYQLRHSLRVLEQDIIGNRSKIRIRLVVEKLSGYGYFTSEQRPWNIKVGTTTVKSGSTSYDFNNYSSLTLGEHEMWVNHDNDGAKSISISGYFSGYSNMGSATTSQTHTLPAIPRGNRFVTYSFVIGEPIRLSIEKTVSSYSSKVELYFGETKITEWTTSEENDGETPVHLTYDNTVKNKMLDALPKDEEGIFTFVCKTLSGSTQIGSPYRSGGRGVVPSSIKPNIGTVTISDVNELVTDRELSYVQGISRLKVSAPNMEAGYGSAIRRRSIKLDIHDVAGATEVTFPAINKDSIKLLITLEDTRGRITTDERTITQLPYSVPTISHFSLDRYDPTDKSKVNFNLRATRTSLKAGTVEKNGLIYRIERKAKGAMDWSVQKDWSEWSSENIDLADSYLGQISDSLEYAIRVLVRDAFQHNIFEVTLKASERLWARVTNGVFNFLEHPTIGTRKILHDTYTGFIQSGVFRVEIPSGETMKEFVIPFPRSYSGVGAATVTVNPRVSDPSSVSVCVKTTTLTNFTLVAKTAGAVRVFYIDWQAVLVTV